jgi:hypothetical protein
MNAAEVDMKCLKMVLLVFSVASATAYAQSPAQPPEQIAPPAQTEQPQHAQKPRFWHEIAPAKKTDTCVGPVSYCTPFFGS